VVSLTRLGGLHHRYSRRAAWSQGASVVVSRRLCDAVGL